LFSLLSIHSSGHPLDLHSFPTRRSSDLFARRPPTVLTPHPGEAGRLLASSAREIQKDRLAAATTLAKKSRAVTVLKGWGSLIARSEEHTSELQSRGHLVCRLLLEKKNKT